MNTKYIILCLALLIPQTVMAQSVPNCKLKDDRVERIIADKARKLQGHEYCQFRRYDSIEDIDGDTKDDFIVIYVVEGVHGSMNHFLQFMLVYLSSDPKGKPLEIQVGERGERSVEAVDRVENGRIITKDQIWKSNDPLCCPSGRGQSIYEIKNKKLIKSQESNG